MKGVIQYHINKLKFHKQRLNVLYQLTDDYKQVNNQMYRDLVKKDRRAIREHIEILKEVREYADNKT